MPRYNNVTGLSDRIATALTQYPTHTDVDQYGESFCRVLGSVYRTLRVSEPIFMPQNICCPFYFGNQPTHYFVNSARSLERLADVAKVDLDVPHNLKVFDGNMLLVLKPAELQYWLRPVAMRDADEAFRALVDRGY